MDKTRGGLGVQLPPLKTIRAHWLATHGRLGCGAGDGRPALVSAFRGVYVHMHRHAHYTEGQCSNPLTVIVAVRLVWPGEPSGVAARPPITPWCAARTAGIRKILRNKI